MKHIFKNSLFLFSAIAFSWLVSCKKDVKGNTHDDQKKDTIVPTRVVLEDTLARLWVVTKSTHNGDPDPGTVGMKLDFFKGGTYKLINTGYDGTWEFLENNTKILIDKNDPSWKTTWTIQKLTAKSFIVTFKSPFSGGSVYWELEPQ
jgi:hypothetical protein